jgi:CRP-like cAMP-binding protein
MFQDIHAATGTPPTPQLPLSDGSRAPRLAQFAAGGRSELFGPGHAIYTQGEAASFVYQVVFGVVRTTMLTRHGRRVVREFYMPGEIFGLERNGSYTASAEAIGNTRVIGCERMRLARLAAEDPMLSVELWSWLLLNGERAEHLSLLGRSNAIEKIAHFLVDMAQRTSVNRRLELPMSRYDIADYLGLSSETVCRTFKTLRERGLIATEGRSVIFLNMRDLRRLDGAPAQPQSVIQA